MRRGPAVPLTFTVEIDRHKWVIRGWYHGTTMVEALHPIMICERWLSGNEAPEDATWRQLYTQVAIAFEDLANIQGITAYPQ